MKHRDASCRRRNVYDISISLNRVFVYEGWIGYNLVLRLKVLPKDLSYFEIFEKQDSSQVKPQQLVQHIILRNNLSTWRLEPVNMGPIEHLELLRYQSLEAGYRTTSSSCPRAGFRFAEHGSR